MECSMNAPHGQLNMANWGVNQQKGSISLKNLLRDEYNNECVEKKRRR